jgi:hypothetical protein
MDAFLDELVDWFARSWRAEGVGEPPAMLHVRVNSWHAAAARFETSPVLVGYGYAGWARGEARSDDVNEWRNEIERVALDAVRVFVNGGDATTLIVGADDAPGAWLAAVWPLLQSAARAGKRVTVTVALALAWWDRGGLPPVLHEATRTLVVLRSAPGTTGPALNAHLIARDMPHDDDAD